MSVSVWKKALVGGVIASLTLIGCSAQPDDEGVDEATPVVEEEPEVAVEVSRHPLTGEEMDPSQVTGPAVMAKIDHENRPYLHLHRADVVWQQLIPQNGTRFLAVWHSDVPDEVGYVRSFRAHDYYMAGPYGGVLATAGLFEGLVPYLEALRNDGVKDIVWDLRNQLERKEIEAPLWTVADKAYSMATSVVFDTDGAQEAFSDFAPPQQYFDYVSDVNEATASLIGEPVNTITAYFSESTTNNYVTSRWTWNAAEGVFEKVWINGDEILVESGENLTATNIVVISVEHDDVVGQPTARFQGGSGPAWIATNGKIAEIDWDAGASATDPITLTTEDGQPVYLAPGITWILVYPGDASTARTAGWGGPGSLLVE